MCGPSTPSSSGESNIVRGGRGSNIAEKKKSKTEMAIGQGLSKFVGSMLGGAAGGPAGAFAFSKFLGDIAKGSTTNEINLSTGRLTSLGSGSTGGSGDDNTASSAGGGLLLAQQEAAAKTAASEKTAATAAAKEAKRKKSATTTKASTILAGKKIAEDKLKTKLGQ